MTPKAAGRTGGTRLPHIALLLGASMGAQLAQLSTSLPLLSLRASEVASSASLVGLIAAMPWIGMTMGVAQVNLIAHRLGARNTIWLGILISALGIILIGLIPHRIEALILGGLIIGLGKALRWIALETWLYDLPPASWRGRVVGINETILGLGFAAGPWLVSLMSGTELMIAALISLGVGALCLTPLPSASQPPFSPRGLGDFLIDKRLTLRVMPLSVTCILVAGFIDISLVGLLAHYARMLSLETQDGLRMMGWFGAGGMLGAFPFGWWADKRGVPPAAVGASLIGVVGVALSMLPASVLMLPGFLLIGVACGGLFALAFVDVALLHNPRRIGRFMSTVGALYTLFGALGPSLSGLAIDIFGPSSFPLVLISLFVMSTFSAHKARRRAARQRITE